VAINGRKQLGHSLLVFCGPDNREATGEVIHRSAMVFGFYDEPSYKVGVDHRPCNLSRSPPHRDDLVIGVVFEWVGGDPQRVPSTTQERKLAW
jgi:hypothetical protein